MSLNYLQGLNPATWYYKIKYIFQESHLGLSRQKICEVKSHKQYFLLVGTELSLVFANLRHFFPPWMGWPQYLEQIINEFPAFNYFNS